MEDARETHRIRARERARLDTVKQQRKEREKQKREYYNQLEENYKKLEIMYQQLYNQHLHFIQFMQLQNQKT